MAELTMLSQRQPTLELPDRGQVTGAGGGQQPTEATALPPVVAALLDPAAYPHAAGELRLHETHISWVVLAGHYAYKVKKPVNFGFLDFSTLAQRAAACAEEVRLNQRLCPTIYLGVVPLVARGNGYSVGSAEEAGAAVEWAVKMRRLPAGGMLPKVLTDDAAALADGAQMRRIAALLARFHAEAAAGPEVVAWGLPEIVAANWADNFAQTATLPEQVLPQQLRTATEAYVARFLVEQRALLVQRVANGRVREGHGDLHSGNICLEGRHLHLFDCLEFSLRLRCADVAAEVAFLAMDLDHHGRADLATIFVDAYQRASGDRELVLLLPFYKAYRAWVRGKVLALRLAEPGLSPDAAAQLAAEARRYFVLAWSYLGGVGGPYLVVTMGLSATGKTSLARELAGRLGYVQLSSDVVRKELLGIRLDQHRFESFGRGAYGAGVTRRTYATLRRRAAQWLRRGQSVILDATFGQPTERAAVRRLAARLGVPLVLLHCQVDEAVIRQRLVERLAHEQTSSDARLAIWPALRAAFIPPLAQEGAISVEMTGAVGVAAEQAIQAILAAGQQQP